MEQKRFLIALILSAVILVGWSYLFPVVPPEQNNNAAPQTSDSTPSPASASAPATVATQTPPPPSAAGAPAAPDDVPQRTLTISTALYEAKFDTRGAVATSWIIKQNRDTGRPIYSVAGDKNNRQPLQLISPEGLKQGAAPFLLVTGDAGLDAPLATRNYRLNGVDGESGEVYLELKPGETKRIEFVMQDPSTGLDVVKGFTFDADRYSVDLQTRLVRGNQPLPKAHLTIGPSIGDQGVPYYTFYSVAPEGVAIINNELSRLYASSINSDNKDVLTLDGAVDWASVGDTYFAMAAVLPKPLDGLVYRTSKYQHEADGNKEDRFLITAFVPVPTDGASTLLYVGPKDHYLLTNSSKDISAAFNRNVDLERLIDYGFGATLSRPIAVQILRAIKFLNNLTGSYGIAIILFTIILYSLFFPLKWRSSKSMKKAQKLAPRMKELQEKIKGMKQNDPRLKELQVEQLRLMKEGNPLGGCLPLLIQMPFLFALFRAITISIDFRQAQFLWLPDLSAADPIPLLPFLMAGSMLVLQLITPAPSADPLQRKMMAVVLPAMMLYMMWSAPAGLLVYWLVGNIVGFAQQILINRMIKSTDDEEPPEKNKAETKPPKNLNPARAS